MFENVNHNNSTFASEIPFSESISYKWTMPHGWKNTWTMIFLLAKNPKILTTRRGPLSWTAQPQLHDGFDKKNRNLYTQFNFDPRGTHQRATHHQLQFSVLARMFFRNLLKFFWIVWNYFRCFFGIFLELFWSCLDFLELYWIFRNVWVAVKMCWRVALYEYPYPYRRSDRLCHSHTSTMGSTENAEIHISKWFKNLEVLWVEL